MKVYTHQPRKRLLYKISPLLKIPILLVLSIIIFLISNVKLLIFLFSLCVILIFIERISPLQVFSQMKFIFLLLIIILIFQIIYSDVIKGLQIILQFVLLYLFSLLLLTTSSMSKNIDAFTKLIYPLKYMHINIRLVSFLIALTLRFIPLLHREAEIIKEAQNARGAYKIPVYYLLSFLHRSFHITKNLTEAIESRARDYFK